MAHMEQLVKVNIPEEARRLAKAEAARRGLTLSDYLSRMIHEVEPTASTKEQDKEPEVSHD